MIGSAEAVVFGAFARGLRPDPVRSVSSWAEEKRHLSQKGAAEPGPWRNERTPYLREIMDCLSSDSPVERVVFMKASQIGGTEVAFNFIGYVIDQSPGPTLMIQPTLALAKRASKQRLQPMIDDCPSLKERVTESKSRDTGNTILSKDFPGGVLVVAGANSAADLRSMPAKYLIADEVDNYPHDLDGEGSPLELAERRTSTFARRKIFILSTPLTEGTSVIAAEFKNTDQRYYFVPCPHCNAEQVIKFENIKWDKAEDGRPILPSVHLVCDSAACGKKIPEFHKTWMLERGRWIGTAKSVNEKTVGFHLSSLYSPVGWFSWADAVGMFHKADTPQKLKVFVNTVLGETYKIKAADTPDWQALSNRRETYPIGIVPLQACLLTAACDVQKDRIECLVWGWNRREVWMVDHIVMTGDTSLPETYLQIDEQVLARHFVHASGSSMQVRILGIDSGFMANRVYEFVRNRDPRRVIALDGREKMPYPIGPPKKVDIRLDGKRLARAGTIFPVGTNFLKGDLYARLKINKPTDEMIAQTGYPSSFIHFPQFDDEFFKQLTAEQLVLISKKRGPAKYAYEKIYTRNEILDMSCYNIAVYHGCGAHRFTEANWKELEAYVGAQHQHAKSIAPPPAPKPPPQKPKAAPQNRDAPKRRSYWDR